MKHLNISKTYVSLTNSMFGDVYETRNGIEAYYWYYDFENNNHVLFLNYSDYEIQKYRENGTIISDNIRTQNSLILVKQTRTGSVLDSSDDFIMSEEQIDYESESYIRLDQTTTGLAVDMFVDECREFIFSSHVLVCRFRNSYDKDSHNYVPVTVSEHPKIVSDKTINLKRSDVIKIFNWVRKFRDYLVSISTMQIRYKHLYKAIAVHLKKSYIEKFALEELSIKIYDDYTEDCEYNG